VTRSGGSLILRSGPPPLSGPLSAAAAWKLHLLFISSFTMFLYDLPFLLHADDMFVYQSGPRREQGTKNETSAPQRPKQARTQTYKVKSSQVTKCLCITVCFTVWLFISPDLDGYRTPKMRHWPCKTQNRSRNPNTKLEHCRPIQTWATLKPCHG